MSDSNTPQAQPKFELAKYREFIRDAAPYVSLICGRRLAPSDADLMSDEEITKLAVLIDSRAEALGNAPKK